MKVALLEYTPNPARVVANAARLCYSEHNNEQLTVVYKGSDPKAILDKVLGLGHFSVLEHASFTFGIDGVSRACSHQLVRHRIASFSQQSQRYVPVKGDLSAVIPTSIVENPAALRKMESFLRDSKDTYDDLIALGIPAEDARYVLPNAAETNLVMTMNARELRHFFNLRCCNRAQWEIREMATEMLMLVKHVAAILFENAGPGCLSGVCPEGKLSCGKQSEVKAFYKMKLS